MNWYLEVLKNYSVFDGRAGREEFWHFTFLNLIISIVLYFTLNELWAVYTVAILIPSFAVSVRRLHDIDRSGWWILSVIVPVVLLFMMLLDGKPGQNQYGFNPKDVIA